MSNGRKPNDFNTRVVFIGIALLVSIAGFSASALYTGLSARLAVLERIDRQNTNRISDAIARLKVTEEKALENERHARRRETRLTRLETYYESLKELVK